MMAMPLLVGNYHYLSDIVAGGFVGASTAIFTVALWEVLRSSFAWNRKVQAG